MQVQSVLAEPLPARADTATLSFDAVTRSLAAPFAELPTDPPARSSSNRRWRPCKGAARRPDNALTQDGSWGSPGRFRLIVCTRIQGGIAAGLGGSSRAAGTISSGTITRPSAIWEHEIAVRMDCSDKLHSAACRREPGAPGPSTSARKPASQNRHGPAEPDAVGADHPGIWTRTSARNLTRLHHRGGFRSVSVVPRRPTITAHPWSSLQVDDDSVRAPARRLPARATMHLRR